MPADAIVAPGWSRSGRTGTDRPPEGSRRLPAAAGAAAVAAAGVVPPGEPASGAVAGPFAAGPHAGGGPEPVGGAAAGRALGPAAAAAGAGHGCHLLPASARWGRPRRVVVRPDVRNGGA